MPELTYRDKIFKHRLKVVYRGALVLAVVVAVIAMIKIQIENRVYTEAEVLSKIDKVGAEGAIYQDYDGKLLVYSDDGISAYDTKGNQIWNKTYEMQSPIINTNAGYVVAGDYKGSKIYIMNEAGPVSEVETNMPIMNLTISAKGVVAATLQDDSTTWITLYSSDGKSLANVKTSMKLSGYPIAASISADNIKLGVSYLKAQSGEINASVAFYNFGDVGQNETDNLVSGFDYEDTVIPFLSYVNENTAIALSEDKLLIYKGKEKPSLDNSVDLKEEVKSVFYDDTYVALIFNNTETEDAYRLDLYNLDGELQFSYVFDVEYQNILVNHDNVIIYNDAKVLILSAKGNLKYDGDMGGDLVSVVPTDSRTKFMVVRGDKIEMVKLH